ncbi:hypothetical protein BRC66_01065 [Halobacteriales archaeon QH_2_66_30]|nr:MAG: hypothetical protein BRC66_01065 [Halobacteriales archaeon QH_2_66_30]
MHTTPRTDSGNGRHSFFSPCEEHGESEEFQSGYSTVAFHCERCGYEIEITAHDLHEWRDFGEMC